MTFKKAIKNITFKHHMGVGTSKAQESPGFEVHITPLRSYKRPALVPVFTNRKKSEELLRTFISTRE